MRTILKSVILVSVITLGIVVTPLTTYAQFPGTNGKIYFDDPNGNLTSINSDGTGRAAVTNPSDYSDPYQSPGSFTVSKDGSKIAYENGTGIAVANIDGTGEVQVTSSRELFPAFTPDGSKVVFVTNNLGALGIVNVDGTGVRTLYTAYSQANPNLIDNTPAVSPDGTKVVFSLDRSTVATGTFVDLDTIPVGGGSLTTLLAGNHSGAYSPDWSPDGNSIVYFSVTNVKSISTIPASGGTPTVLINEGSTATFEKPVWSPDGTQLLLDDVATDNVAVANADGTNARDITTDGNPATSKVDVPLYWGALASSSSNSSTITIPSGDNQPSQAVTIASGMTYIIDGIRGNTTVQSGGTLKGNGTVGILDVQTNGIVSPGHSPGCINSGNLTLSGTYDQEIGGTTPCSGYDQLNVTGTVDVTGATLNTTLYNGFKPAAGQTYTIINNDGSSDAVTGTFTNLAEGATFNVSGYVFKITYKGGDGNDVVLSVVSIPATPNTGFTLLSARPLATLLTSILAAGAIGLIARRFSRVGTRR